MKKTCLIIFVFFLLASFFPVNIRAQENPPNKIGINIGSHLEYFDQAAETVGPGGWITIMPQSLSPEVLNPLFERHPEVNVIIRTHYPQTVPSPSEAASLVASLGNINTQNKIFIMPWNEPNLARECGGVGNETNPGDSACAPQVTAYTDALFAQLGASGLLHTKIEVLSPMINQSAPNFAAFVDALGGGSFYRQFYGVSMNLYNFQEGCPADNLLCKPNPLLNPIKYREILAGYGVGDMKVFGIETGVVIGHPIYDAVAMFNFLTQAYESWVKDPNFIMASPYIYDPEIGTHPMWLWGSAVEEFIEFLQDLSGHPIYGEAAEDILKLFEEWLQEKLRLGELVLCDDGSYAPSLDLCGLRGIPGLGAPFSKCVGDSAETRVCRPDECNTCNLNPPLTYACATTFTVHDTVSFRWEDSDFICEGEHWVEREWGGNIIIDPSDVTVPFVGKKGEEDVQKYLADYFEGTAFYYGPDVDLEDCKKVNPDEAEREACQNEVERIVAEGGVFRKLAPKDYQDKLKREMVQRAKDSKAGLVEDGIHDYLIEHAGESMRLSQITPIPEMPLRENYDKIEEWQNAIREWWPNVYVPWKGTPSGKLWAAVPMFSREDSLGYVLPSVNTKALDTVTISPPIPEEQVPHLARLFEVTRELQTLVLPWPEEEEEEGKAPEKTLLASSNPQTSNPPQVLGEKTLLAQACPRQCPIEIQFHNVPPPAPGEYTFISSYCVPCDICDGISHLKDLRIGDSGGSSGYEADHVLEVQCPHYNDTSWGTGYSASRVRMDVGSSFTVSVSYSKATSRGPGCCVDGGFGACRIALTQDEQGNYQWESTCGVPPPPPKPACGLAEPPPYPACEYESITDENPNDTICCNPIVIDLDAIDQFPNPNYTPCEEIVLPDGRIKILNPECKTKVTRHVHRDVKVDLFHPYLDEIWEQTTDSFRGFFNIFRPEVEPPFEDLAAHSYISYHYGAGSITPDPPWYFYFPHLGGIQRAKEWVLETLNPSGKGAAGRASPLPPSGPTLPPTPTPATGPTTLDYTIDFRNPGISISEETKRAIIDAVKGRWEHTEIEQYWGRVYTQALVNDWNPAFVIALWIEESGAGHLDNWDLGCTAGEKNNITSQLFCLFDLPYKDAPFEEFMCRYSEGHYPCVFEINPNFPGNLKYWYDQLTQ